MKLVTRGSVVRRAVLAALLATPLAAPLAARAGDWDVPAPGACQPADTGAPMLVDVAPFPFEPGDVIDAEKLSLIRDYIPPLLWENRDQFFFEGMRLEVGPCFRDYSPPDFYRAASEKFKGQAKLTADGGLEDYTAGMPFPPELIDRGDPLAGLRWVWNYANRYQGAGFRSGPFRISDIVGIRGRAEPFIGEIYKVQLAHRAERTGDDYRAKGARSYLWVAGGKMTEPFNARGHAWRQFRSIKTETKTDRTDDLHAYLAQARRVRRLSAAYVEGLYLPSFGVGVSTVMGSDAAGASESQDGTVTPKRSGWEGLEVRPIRAHWSLLGLQDVLAPINAAVPMFPTDPDRQFGVWGVSFASERWDLRRALVLEARYKEPDEERDETARMVLHVDLQSLAPLYYQSWDARGETIDVGLFAGRWSEDRPDYPKWPDDPKRQVRVIDPVGAAMANVSQQVGWRRESWQAVSIPLEERAERDLSSVKSLTRGR